MMSDFLPDDNKICPIKEEGIYFFGGRHHDGMVTNSLKILKIGTVAREYWFNIKI